MKQIAKFFMVLVLMISFTGFGNTTTDPERNSEAVFVQVHEDEQVVVVNEVEENRVNDLFKKADLEFSKTNFNELISLKSEYWQTLNKVSLKPDRIFDSENLLQYDKNLNQSKFLYKDYIFRAPRDGISFIFS